MTPVSVTENCVVPPAFAVTLVGVIEIDCGFKVTVADACSVLTAVLIAVIVAFVAELIVAGAVYKPALESVPGPERLQVTELLETPASVAENCVVPPAYRLELFGVIVIDCAEMFAVAEACRLLTAALVAMMVAFVAEVVVAGAVYRPVLEIVPGPERLHSTAVFEMPETVAENCAVPPAWIFEVEGVIEIVCAWIFTVALAISELTAELVAVIVAVAAEVAVAGAV